MSDLPTSPYYPPRRHWCARACHGFVGRVPKLRGLLRGVRPWGHFALSLAVPGHVFLHIGWPRLGRGIQISYSLGLLVFLAALGYAAADLAFGLLIAAHAASLLQLLLVSVGRPVIAFRLFAGLGVWAGLALGVYFPLRDAMLEHWLVPLKVASDVVVVHRMANTESFKAGDLLAYRLDRTISSGVTVGGGFGIDEVIARPGDHVRITPSWVLVNGAPQWRRPHMPREAEFILKQNQWFLWPRLDITHQNVAEASLAAAWLQTGMIDETQIVGRPFRHWFGRPQLVP